MVLPRSRGILERTAKQPRGYNVEDIPRLRREDMINRWFALSQFTLPQEAAFVTAFADVHKKLLYYEVRAWAQDSTSWVVDYGVWPGQSRSYFQLANVKHTLATAYPNHKTWDEQLKVGVKDLFIGNPAMPGLLNREWRKENGEVLRITLAAIDANSGAWCCYVASEGLSHILWYHDVGYRFAWA